MLGSQAKTAASEDEGLATRRPSSSSAVGTAGGGVWRDETRSAGFTERSTTEETDVSYARVISVVVSFVYIIKVHMKMKTN